jgi:hypothetical protein
MTSMGPVSGPIQSVARPSRLVGDIGLVGVVNRRQVYIAIRSPGDRDAGATPGEIARATRGVELDAGHPLGRDPKVFARGGKHLEETGVQIVCVSKIVERRVACESCDARAHRLGLRGTPGCFFGVARA